MKCPRCQHENPPQAKFCVECAAPLAQTCGNCGTPLPAAAKFCPECAHPSSAAGGEPRFATPQAYTPKHLAERILTSKSALEGERKQVTVLFADLKGSMELLADRDPEDARKLLDPVLERMMEAVHRYEGTVNQIMGDGIMALFGAPLAHEDHAVRACYAALRMQEAIGRYAEELRCSHGLDVQIRVGLNSGEVVVRSIGSDLRMDYTAVGQTTHLAARMEQLARPGSSLLTADTLRLAEGYVQVKPLGPVPVKGLAEPIETYELVRGGAVRSRMQAAAARGLTRFVGRDREMEALRQVLDKARAGHGQVVAVVGEPGVGKSRLFWEFTHSHRTQGWLLLEAGSVSYGKATPYLPIIDLLKAYFQIETRDDARKIQEKLTGKLLTLERALEPTLLALLALLDVPVEDPQWQALDPPQRRQRTLEAVKRLLLRESQVQPLCLVFEDLHWIDSETQALLESLVESLPTARLLLLVNYRPEYQHGWGGKTYYSQLRIDPLPPESAEELLEALLGADPGLQPLRQLLVSRTEGNPFFLEESVRTLVETQGLIGERGAYRLAKTLPSIQVPATVQAVLTARIDRLPPKEKTLLQTAAVIGKDVPFPLLQTIADLPEEAFRQGLSHLQAAEFLYEASLFPELEYTFKHALTHEVAYGSLLQERRRALHARIVGGMEALYPGRLAEHIDRLAHHALRGEVWTKALAYLRQAGVRAAIRSAHREAVACFHQALAALKHLPDSREAREQAIDLRFNLRTSLLGLGDLGRIRDELAEVLALAEALGDQRRLAQACCFTSHVMFLMAEYDRAIEAARRALAIARELGDPRLELVANFYLGQTYANIRDYARAADLLRKVVASLEGEKARERSGLAGLAVVSRTNLAWALAMVGEFSEAKTRAEEAVRIAEEEGKPGSLLAAYIGLGGLLIHTGEFPRCIQLLERGRSLCEGGGFPVLCLILHAQLGFAYVSAGRLAEGIALIEEALRQSASTRLLFPQSYWAASVSEFYLMAGRVPDALAASQRGLDLSSQRGERGYQAWAFYHLGQVASGAEPLDVQRAEACYRDAMGLADEQGMRPLMARCQVGLGRLYARANNRTKAREHLTAAATRLRELGMTFWLEQAEGELKALG